MLTKNSAQNTPCTDLFWLDLSWLDLSWLNLTLPVRTWPVITWALPDLAWLWPDFNLPLDNVDYFEFKKNWPPPPQSKVENIFNGNVLEIVIPHLTTGKVSKNKYKVRICREREIKRESWDIRNIQISEIVKISEINEISERLRHNRKLGYLR